MDQYVEEVKEYLNSNPGLTEDEIVMYVYLDLASRLRFDADFFFGGNKRKSEIYRKASIITELNKCFDNHKIICKSSAYIFEYILKKLGINVVTINEGNPLIKYEHVVNIVISADGKKSYQVDLQNDLTNIHYHCFTSNFGKNIYNDKEYIISPLRQKQMHQKLGYISDENPYLDDYVSQFRMYMPSDLSLAEQVNLVLTNIEPYPFLNVSYWERRWKHEQMLKEIFGSRKLSNKLHTVEFYQKIDGETINNNGYFMFDKDGVTVYYYNIDTFCYEAYDVPSFAQKVLDEDICYRQGIKGLNREINLLKNQKVKKI